MAWCLSSLLVLYKPILYVNKYTYKQKRKSNFHVSLHVVIVLIDLSHFNFCGWSMLTVVLKLTYITIACCVTGFSFDVCM